MKKYLVVLVAMLLVVTGCGGKKLTCTLEETDQKSTVAMEFDKENVVTKIKMTVSVPLENELTAEEKEYMESYMGIMCAAFDYDGVSCETKTGSKSVDVVITMDMDKMDQDTKDDMGYSKEEATYDAMKKSLEESGYTCK